LIDEILVHYEKVTDYAKKLYKIQSDFPDLDIEFWQYRFSELQNKIDLLKQQSEDAKAEGRRDDKKSIDSKLRELKGRMKLDEEKLKLQGIKGLKNACVKLVEFQAELKRLCKTFEARHYSEDFTVVDAIPCVKRYL